MLCWFIVLIFGTRAKQLSIATAFGVTLWRSAFAHLRGRLRPVHARTFDVAPLSVSQLARAAMIICNFCAALDRPGHQGVQKGVSGALPEGGIR